MNNTTNTPNADAPTTSTVPFQDELRKLINKYCMENGSDTPDFVLAQYLHGCLMIYETAIKGRDNYFGIDVWADDKLKKHS